MLPDACIPLSGTMKGLKNILVSLGLKPELVRPSVRAVIVRVV